jgi:hypothetical protein
VPGDDRILSAEDMERLTPDERHRLVNQSVVTDVSELDPEFLARVRAKGRALLAERGVVPKEGDAG